MKRIFDRIFRGVGKHRPTEKVTSIEKFWLRISGMRFEVVYEMLETGDNVEITLYRIAYVNRKDSKIAEKSAVCEVEEILELLNSCNVMGWNGFHGDHPRHVCDGEMFSLVADVNRGLQIKAEGSENFPRGYKELIARLNQILNERNNINNK